MTTLNKKSVVIESFGMPWLPVWQIQEQLPRDSNRLHWPNMWCGLGKSDTYLLYTTLKFLPYPLLKYEMQNVELTFHPIFVK